MAWVDRVLGELIGLAYEAGAEPERWSMFLDRAGDALCDGGCTLQIEDLAHATGSLAVCVRVDPRFMQAYSHYAPLNPWTRAGADAMRAGVVMIDEKAVPTRELQKTEFYADFLRPQNVTHSFASVLERNGDVTSFVSFNRSAKRGPWRSDELGLLAHLTPHLQRVMELHRRLGAQRRVHEALVETADRLPWGVVFLDAANRLTFANIVARGLDTAMMKRVLAVAARGGGVVPRADHSPVVVSVAWLRSQSSGSRAPVFAGDPALANGPLRAVFVIDPEVPRAPPEALMRQMFMMTRAEARVAISLARGHTLREVADATGVAPATVRTHLKRIFEKTGTRRQSALVRLLILLTSPL